jgi:hypothetical protein
MTDSIISVISSLESYMDKRSNFLLYRNNIEKIKILFENSKEKYRMPDNMDVIIIINFIEKLKGLILILEEKIQISVKDNFKRDINKNLIDPRRLNFYLFHEYEINKNIEFIENEFLIQILKEIIKELEKVLLKRKYLMARLALPMLTEGIQNGGNSSKIRYLCDEIIQREIAMFMPLDDI